MVTGEEYRIDGMPVVRTVTGPWTGDVRHQTSDGRWWEQHRGITSPNTMPTGAVIRTIETVRK